MNETKVSQQINDVVGDNVKKLAQLFPSAVKDGEVDFEALKEELGSFTEVGAEKYELTWAGKADAKRIAREDIVGKTLKYIPEDSKDADTTENLYIEGDNLEVLKLLRQNYYGAIKMIYIDPPYNTGKDFIYKDSFSMSQGESDMAEGLVSADGERFSVNKISQNRFHANWLSMMYPRLSIAKDLLKEEGVIFISIDDNEVSNLRQLCDDIFGNTNFIAQFTRKGSGGRQDSKYYAIVHEYVLCYAKNSNSFESGKMIKDDEVYPFYDEKLGKKYKTQLLRKWGENSRRSDRPNLYYPITDPEGNDFYPMLSETEEGCWRWGKDTMFTNIEKGLVEFKKRNGQWVAYEKILEPDEGEYKTKLYTTVIDDISNNTGASLIKDLFEVKAFDYPKPVDLIYRVLQLANVEKDDIVIDFFSGSASTAHAVMKYNADNNFDCKFIMVQYPEEIEDTSEMYSKGMRTICDIGEERIRRAGDKIKSEYPDTDLDIGFKVFRIADTNIKWNSLMDMGQLDLSQIESTPDLMDFMPNTKDIDVVYELMLRQRDVALSESVELLSDIGSRTYLYASSFLVCLETEVTESLVEKIAAIDPLPIKFIFRDSAFKDDIALKDETFRRLKALVEKNSGESKPTYTVEFI
ncbi:MAG: site-specific DNA-methyltransferase [Lachnospiraceae bacterium]|nr:site-specific DNA-methyltransferase [Lachnospiraceae bacterium]